MKFIGCPKGFGMGNLPYDSCCRKYHFSHKELVRLSLYLGDKITNQMCYTCTKTYFLAKTVIVKKWGEAALVDFNCFQVKWKTRKRHWNQHVLFFNHATIQAPSMRLATFVIITVQGYCVKTMFKSSDRTKSSMFHRLQARSIQKRLCILRGSVTIQQSLF